MYVEFSYHDLYPVLGFAQKQYQFEERSTPYSLAITVLSPPQSLVSNIGLIVTAVDGTAVGKFTG